MTTWNDLPAPVRAVVEQHTGPVAEATELTNGRSSDITVILRADRTVFLKGVRGVSPRMRWLRNEITANELAAGVAPAVLFHADVEDWLVVGFEYVQGRAANLAPGSPDLPLVANTVARISSLPAPGLRPLADRWCETDWWERIADRAPTVDIGSMSRNAARLPELVRGANLVHTDLHGDQFVIGDGTVHVIDWGLPGAGAPWVDAAFLVLRLIEAGHQTADAERWALSLPGFADVDHTVALDAFSAYVAGLWSYWALEDRPGARHRAQLARAWAGHRADTPHTTGPSGRRVIPVASPGTVAGG